MTAGIKRLDVLFPGYMRLGVTQHALNDFVIGTQLIQVGRNAAPEAVPAIPRQAAGLDCRTNDALGKFVHIHVLPVARVKDHSGSRVVHGRAMLVQDLGQGWNHRNGLAALPPHLPMGSLGKKLESANHFPGCIPA